MDGRVFTATKTVKLIGKSTVGIYVGSFFGGIKAGDYIDIEVYKISSPFTVFKSTKRVSKKGSSMCITLDADWGFELDDVIVVKYKSLDVSPEFEGREGGTTDTDSAEKETV